MALSDIAARLAAAEAAAGRPAGSVRLIAVSKEQPHDRVEAVLAAGHRAFGENRVPEAQKKWPAWRDRHPGVELHLIGPLQTNKARAAVELFDVIQSLDRTRLADTLARLAQERGESPEIFIQINTGAEPQKSGVLPDHADGFIADARALDLPIVGLMCIPPFDEDATPHFRSLAAIAGRNGLDRLSMGMSDDFETAVAEGATEIRVGSAIFGARPPKE